MWRDSSNHVHLSANEARGGEIILHARWQRAIFLLGLVGFVLLALVLAISGLGG